ncbi:MAG: YciI family protein [Alphaproteobacteria bacterium]|nr:YciI family protein [Alphaproteobacteria bacterium]
MKALIIAYESERDFAMRRAEKAAFNAYMGPWFEYSKELSEAGVVRGGEALQGPDSATCISVAGGRRKVEDGPFIDAKEQIGGFFLIEVPTIDDAVKWAAKCPAAATGYVEVRDVPDYGQEG